MRVLACSVFAATALAAAGVTAAADRLVRHDGVTVRVPQGWRVTLKRINGVVDPVTVFTVSTFRIPDRPQSSGICSRALQRAWRRDGAYVQLTEERDGASRKRMLRRVSQRPRHFHLDAHGAGGLCTPPDSGEIAFHEGGRAFYVFYGFGSAATRARRAAAAALLDTMQIAPRR